MIQLKLLWKGGCKSNVKMDNFRRGTTEGSDNVVQRKVIVKEKRDPIQFGVAKRVKIQMDLKL